MTVDISIQVYDIPQQNDILQPFIGGNNDIRSAKPFVNGAVVQRAMIAARLIIARNIFDT